MKLLIITQKVDRNDPILGFFHQWLLEFAHRADKIAVICLGRGEVNLPANVRVFSLGKEKMYSRLRCVLNFYRYLWRLRGEYDTVFVHMNQEYVLLAGWWWRLSGKKILFWRNHPQGSWLTRIAVGLSDRVFCTSPHSFTARFKKTRLMPAGIDTELFYPNPEIKRVPNSILLLGRLGPIKRPHLLIEAAAELDKTVTNFKVDIVGDPGNSLQDKKYFENLKKIVGEKNLTSKIFFWPSVPPAQTPAYYNSHEIFVNLTPTGSFDKTILEAVACGAKVLTTNRSFDKFSVIGAPGDFVIAENNILGVTNALKMMIENQAKLNTTNQALIELVKREQSLASLAKNLFVK